MRIELNCTLLVFGISGFTGNHFGQHLRINCSGSNLHVVGVVSCVQETLPVGVDSVEVVDVLTRDSILSIIRKIKPSFIVNFIGLFESVRYDELIQSNVVISQAILQAVVDSGTLNTRLLFIGSAAEYGAVKVNPVSEIDPTVPISLYGLSKVFQTNLVQYYHRVHQVQAVIARTFNLTGQGISTSLSVGHFRKQIDAALDADTIKVGNLDSERDFLEVAQAVALYMVLLLHGKCGEVYNVCSGVPVRIGDLLSAMIESSGKSLIVEVSPHLLRGNDISRIYGCRAKLDGLLEEISGK